MIYLVLLFLIVFSSACSIDNCEFCSLKSSEICVNCNPGFTRDELEGCHLSLDSDLPTWRIENCEVLNESSCIKCKEGYFLVSGRCEPICESENCTCFLPYTCLHSKRSLVCDYYCSLCDEQNDICLECEEGYGFNEDKFCIECDIYECKDCGDDYTTCNICYDGFYYDENDNDCYECSSEVCEICDPYDPDVCIKCYDDYKFDDNGNCCDFSCLACFSYPDICSECSKGMFMYEDYCYDCSNHCVDCEDENLCYECENGYELDYNNECIESLCNARDCISCPNSKDQCIECKHDLQLDYNGNCCDSACESCSTYSPNCESCYEGMFLEGSSCNYCSSHCKECHDFYYCLSCEDGYNVSDGDCKKNKKSDKSLVLKIVIPIGLAVLATIIVFIFYCIRRKRLKLQKLKKKMDKTQIVSSDIVNISKPTIIIPSPSVNQIPYSIPQGVPTTYSQAPIPPYQQYANPNQNTSVSIPPVYQYNNPSQVNPNIQNPPVAYPQLYNNMGIPSNYNSPTVIDHLNFTTLVPVIQLDSEKAYNGIKLCMVCNEKFDMDPDIRALPCGHPYHGKCIYNHMVVGGKKQCLYCSMGYA
ncbi:hypothetical protein SteCoe_37219 [Stentor coeruleus]|uniref:RING-type domain-containing protein n=1 Tax=Stentor coeruleus TaxID=5963 RepID=A0A1R2ANI0_9CILI|nr:hypothetical protein SteCoe_37219 [Stentor coeruleus]